MHVITLTRIDDVRRACDDARRTGRRVALVPTMGFFHAGHRSLMQAARRECDLVVVSLFVNPTQFAAGEDLSRYPRDPEGDAAAAAAEGVDVLFVPTVHDMYPEPGRTTVHVADLTDGLCGASRPGHFDGVTTVVTKLFSVVGPCRAYFGRKDAQQLAVVTRLARDLNLPVEVVPCPLVREPSGLAMSSRNAYLSDTDRAAATALSRALHAAVDAIRAGTRDARTVRERLERVAGDEPGVRLDYAVVVDAGDLQPVEQITGEVLLALAAFVGPARLIDNALVRIDDGRVHADLGVVVTGPEANSNRGVLAAADPSPA